MNISIDDIQNLKNVERGDVLVFYVADNDPMSSRETRAITEALGCFIIISPKSRGKIEKLTSQEIDALIQRSR